MKAQATTLYPLVPSGPNFQAAIAFLAELGFDKLWENGGYAGLRFGGAYFILQDIDVPEWQKNQMLVYEVDDLDAYWSEIDARDLPGRFPGARTRPPTDFAWGREVHIFDPAAVCWHVRQSKA
jgi:hypothetical protein